MIEWIVQNNLRTGSGDEEKIEQACKKYGFKFHGIRVIPFSDNLPEVSADMIFYGGTGWINKIYVKYPHLPGIFFNPESVFTHWVNKYGQNAINYGARETTLEEFSKEEYPDNQQFFIRPANDLKDFGGSVAPFSYIKDWAQKINCARLDLGKLPIIVNEPYGIAHEWRLFIVNGKVITGSHYRSYLVLHVYDDIPDRVISFAEEQAQIYSPDEVFVMDVGESNKKLYVVEIGCFNSAGFYASDIDRIVYEVSHVLERSNNDSKSR